MMGNEAVFRFGKNNGQSPSGQLAIEKATSGGQKGVAVQKTTFCSKRRKNGLMQEKNVLRKGRPLR